MEVNPGSDHHHYHVGGGCDDHMNADDDNDTENDNDGDDDDDDDDGSQRSWLLILARTSGHKSGSLSKAVPKTFTFNFSLRFNFTLTKPYLKLSHLIFSQV